MDNGNGLMRNIVFRHKHEFYCGKTTSISHQVKFFNQKILGFDENGNTTNYNRFGNFAWEQIVQKSVKIVYFFDMGGSEKSAKTTVLLLI